MSEPNGTTPAVLKHAHKAFRLFIEHSEEAEYNVPITGETVTARLFRGKIGDIFNATGASNTYYSPIRQLLIDCGSIVILERGSAKTGSVVMVRPDSPPPTVEMIPPPPEDDEKPNVKSHGLGLTLARRLDRLEERLEIAERRAGGINIESALRNHESRLATLESERKDSK
jgi:hypothetical protein